MKQKKRLQVSAGIVWKFSYGINTSILKCKNARPCTLP